MDEFEKMLLMGTSNHVIHVTQVTIPADAVGRTELINEMTEAGILARSTEDIRQSNLEGWMEQKLGEFRAVLLKHGFMSRPGGASDAEVYFRIS